MSALQYVENIFREGGNLVVLLDEHPTGAVLFIIALIAVAAVVLACRWPFTRK